MKAENGKVLLGNTEMDYVAFGSGEKTLVMLPGLGDGLKTVKGMALPMAWMYKSFAREYRVYVFSRKNRLEEGCSTRQMAQDQAEAMKKLGITQADVIGVSQGGMIAQYVAIDAPELVRKLVLAVTASRQNEWIREAVEGWIEMAKAGDYKALFIDTAEKTYSEQKLCRYRALYPVLTRVGAPRTFDRFLIQARACLGHDAYGELDRIKCPVLVIGGEADRIVGVDASREIGERIQGSRLHIYPELGHGAYEEAEDFNRRVLDFLNIP